MTLSIPLWVLFLLALPLIVVVSVALAIGLWFLWQWATGRRPRCTCLPRRPPSSTASSARSGPPASPARSSTRRARSSPGHAELDGTRAELAQAREERDKARLYCAEVASYICDPMYDKVENRAGIAADAEAMATGEMTGRYLDIKMQTERAIRAEAELAAERERREAAEAVLHAKGEMLFAVVKGAKEEFVRVPYGASHEDVAAINEWHGMAAEALAAWEGDE